MSLGRVLIAVALLSLGTTAFAQAPVAAPDPGAGKRPVKVVIYPLLVQTPLFGASLDLPALPGGGGDEGGSASGSTDVSFNTAYLAGFLVETNRIFVEGSGTWADVSAERQLPRVKLDTETFLFQARGGVRVFKGLSVTGGVHRVGMDLHATLELPELGRTLEGTAEPGYWDPMVGVDWRGTHGRWNLQTSFEGGGFGVGNDVDLSGEARADYRLKWFDLRFGYSLSYLKATLLDIKVGTFERKLVVSQTLHGPNVGIGIAF